MKRRFLATIPLFLVLLAGCGSSNPMVGTWKLEISEEMKKQVPAGMKTDMVMNFMGDNTFTVTGEMMGTKLNVKGTYKLEDKKLTLTTTEVDGKKPPGENKPQSVELADDGKSFSAPGMPGGMKIVKQ